MIGDPALGIIIGTDPLTAVPGAHLALPFRRFRLLLFLLLHLQDTGTQHPQAFFPVLQLGLLILALGHDARGDMGHAHRGLRLVDVLPAGAPGPVGIDPDIFHADIHVHLFRHRQHRHRAGRSMDPPLGFRFRYPLHPVHAAFKFHAAINPDAGNLGYHFLKAAQLRGIGIHQFHGPAHGIRVPGIHAEQNLREQSRFLAACPGTDLQDDILVIVGVPGQQQQGQLLLILFQHRL